MIVPRLLVEASVDVKVRGAPFHVLSYLYGTRKYGVYFKVDQFEVAHMIHRSQPRVCQALRTLVDEGYIREGPKLERNIGTYMLLIVRDRMRKRSA